MISLAQMGGKSARKRQFTDICAITLFPGTRITGDEFQESVVGTTKRELYAFKAEAKRWSQTDNRPSAPSASADSATRTSAPHSFRNLHMYLYKCMLLFVCDGLQSFSLCVNAGSTPNVSSSSGLSAEVSSSGPPSAAMPVLTSPGAGQSLCFGVDPLFFLLSLLLVVCSFTGTVESKLNLCGVLT